jgi:DNA-binding XRE family transcriptional regulator
MTIPGGQAQNTTHVVCCNFLATPSVLGAPASLIGSEFPQSTWLRPFDLPRPDTARQPLHETPQNGGAPNLRSPSPSLRTPWEGEILGPLQGEEVSRITGDSQEVSGRDGPVGVPEPPLRGGSLSLPVLKHWRLRKWLSQKELARRAGLTSRQLYKIESGKRGCNPETAQLLADVLLVDLEELRRRREDALDGKAPPSPLAPGFPTATSIRLT